MMTLERYFSEQLAYYRQFARLGVLPFFRDWRQGVFLDNRPLVGLAALFLQTPLLASRYFTFCEPGQEVSLTFAGTVARETVQFRGIAPVTMPGHASLSQPLPMLSLAELCRKCAVTQTHGKRLGLQGDKVVLPETGFGADLVPEVARLLAKLFWQRHGTGYLAAEMVFGIWANLAGYACNTLRLSRACVDEVLAMDVATFTDQSFAAFQGACELLQQIYGAQAVLPLGDALVQDDDAAEANLIDLMF